MVDLAVEAGEAVNMSGISICRWTHRNQYWIAAAVWGLITIWRLAH